MTSVYREARGAATPSTLWTDRVHVPLGAGVAAALSKTRITPNQVSMAAAACTGLGVLSLVLLPDSVWGPVIFLVASFTGYTLDGADGILSRITGRSSRFGGWLDLTLDRIVHMVVFAGFVTRQIIIDDGMSAVIAGLMLLWILSAANAYSGSLLHLKAAQQPAVAVDAPRGLRKALRRLATVPVDFGFMTTSLAVGAILGVTGVVAYSLAAIHAVFLLALVSRARRQLAD